MNAILDPKVNKSNFNLQVLHHILSSDNLVDA